MRKDRSELETYLLEQCEKIALRPDQYDAIRRDLFVRYDIPMGLTMDMIIRAKFAEQTEHILFCLLQGIENFTSNKNIVDEYFMPVEIAKYSNTKMPNKRLRFPLVIKCNQVTDDQWIGAVDTNWFMALREAQLINYNENAQRTLTKIISHGVEYYKITLKENTVKGIRSCLQRGEYIPTPITLNIPLEVDSDFYYDEDQGALVINSLPYFDIADGYHRYVAMCREKDVNPAFNYNWELRIVNFAEDRARYFIYQESLKATMNQMNAKSMNSYGSANIVADRLNKDSTFGLFGEINNHGGTIPAPEFIKVLEFFYFKQKNDMNEKELIRFVKDDIKNKFNHLIDLDIVYLTKKYTYVDLLIMLYVFVNTNDLSSLDKYIKGMTERIHTINPTQLQPSKNISKPLVNNLDKIFQEVR